MTYNFGIPVNYDTLIKELSSSSSSQRNISCIQIQMNNDIKINKKHIMMIKKNIQKNKIKTIFIHASFNIKIGNDLFIVNNKLHTPHLDQLFDEIMCGIKIGAIGIVVHISYELNNMIMFVQALFKMLKSKINIGSFYILFETIHKTNKTNNSLNYITSFIKSFEYESFYKNIGLCIDTCHIFQAGYDINNKTVINNIHNILSTVQHKIILIHLNDSKHPFNSQIDRHARINTGTIKIKYLKLLIEPWKHLPLILETKEPYDDQILAIIQ